MFHNGKKRKPLHFILYWWWTVFVIINTIKFLFFRGFIHVSLHIFFILFSIKIKFPFLKKFWMVDLLDLWCNISTKYGDHFFFFIIEFLIVIWWMIIWIYEQVLQYIWSGRNCCPTYHDFVWIDFYFCTNSAFYQRWKSF